MGSTTETEGITALWVAGAITWGSGYLLTIIGAAAGTASAGEGWPMIALIPLAGPFVLVGTHGDDIDGAMIALPIVFGVVQNVGMIMTVLGLSIRHDVQVPRYATLSDAETASLEIGPMIFGDGAGVGITLRAAE